MKTLETTKRTALVLSLALALCIIAALALLTGCAAEAQPPTGTKPSASQPAAVEEPTLTPTPTPVVQKFGTPDSSFMEVIAEAGVMLPGVPTREVLDERDFDNWVVEGVEVWNADTCGEVTLVHAGGEVDLVCESGRFFLKD